MPAEESIDNFDTNKSEAKAFAYDIVMNGFEIGGGSQRITDPIIQKRMFDAIAYKYGAPYHSGLALGLDRICMLLSEVGNIREVIAFPKNSSGVDPMTNAPDFVDENQLKELNIKIYFDDKFTFIAEEIKKVGYEKIKIWCNENEYLKFYLKDYKEFFKNIKYLLPELDRKLISKVSNSSSMIYEMYDILKYKDKDERDVKFKNKNYKLDQNTISDILENSDPIKDQELRKFLSLEYRKYNKNKMHTFTKVYEAIVLDEIETAKLVDDLDSLFTLTHEVGHFAHFEFVKKHQPKQYAGFDNIIAEVASTLNEHLLFDHLIKVSDSKDFKIKLLQQRIEFIFMVNLRSADDKKDNSFMLGTHLDKFVKSNLSKKDILTALGVNAVARFRTTYFKYKNLKGPLSKEEKFEEYLQLIRSTFRYDVDFIKNIGKLVFLIDDDNFGTTLLNSRELDKLLKVEVFKEPLEYKELTKIETELKTVKKDDIKFNFNLEKDLEEIYKKYEKLKEESRIFEAKVAKSASLGGQNNKNEIESIRDKKEKLLMQINPKIKLKDLKTMSIDQIDIMIIEQTSAKAEELAEKKAKEEKLKEIEIKKQKLLEFMQKESKNLAKNKLASNNDNINFLEKNGFNFFSISDDEMCLCLSAKLYSDCCKKELVLEKKDDYLSFVMAMASPDTYKTYLEMMKEISNNIFEVISKNEKCHFPNCDKKVTLNNLYHNEMSTKNDFVSNRKEMLFDNLYKMGEELFFDFKKDIFDYYGFCEEHNLVNKKIYFEDSHLLDSILYSSLEIVVFKLFQTKIIFESTLIEFKKYFNSFKEEGFKAYFVAGLRKISNFYKSLIMFYEKIKDSILDIQSTKLRMHVLSLPKTSTFFVKDVFAPPVNPKDFTVINSVNNVLQSPKIGVISTFTTKNYTMVYILIDKEDKKMNV
ncbi:hypothetical protein FQR65_LT17179 [Abscondita terminalis]|nr:hypothetical protein FQR65_LT17179 [Abscondita terminalis]